jgi:hypothetical protein
MAWSVTTAKNIKVLNNLNNFGRVKPPYDASVAQIDIGFVSEDVELVRDITQMQL